MKEMRINDANGNQINVSVIGMFRIPDLEKEYVMYSLMDDDVNNENAGVLLGEVVRDEEGNIQVLGILSEENDVVVAYYNEIADQLGGDSNE